MKLFRRILVPFDFSKHSGRALALAAELAREHKGRLVVLHVIAPFHPVTALPEEGMIWIPETDDVALVERRRLEAIVARTVKGRRALRVICKVVIGDPFTRIADTARNVDCIVMATAGRTGLSHLVIGSVAEKVVRHSSVPVLTLRSEPVRAKVRTPPHVRSRGRR